MITPVSIVIAQQVGRPDLPPARVTDADLRELQGQRRLFPVNEREAALEQLIRDWKAGRA